MLRLNKKTEYALLALRQLADATAAAAKAGEAATPAGPSYESGVMTAKAIAGRYNIPEMLLAKVLQRLKKHGLVSAAKGSGGGYRLARPLGQVPLLAVLGVFDKEATLTQCQDSHGACEQLARCDIKGPLAVLNRAILAPLEKMTLAELFVGASSSAASAPSLARIRPRHLAIESR